MKLFPNSSFSPNISSFDATYKGLKQLYKLYQKFATLENLFYKEITNGVLNYTNYLYSLPPPLTTNYKENIQGGAKLPLFRIEYIIFLHLLISSVLYLQVLHYQYK